MNRRGLMARLADVDPSRSIPVRESISAHLHDLFNATLGSCQSPGDSGIPPIADIIRDFPQASEKLEACIRQVIKEYEPRLSATSIKASQIEGEPKISIEIHATIVGSDAGSLFLMTELDHRGRLELT